MANRRQHTIPQFYLRPFLSPGWVYRRGAFVPRATNSPSGVAVHRDYYGRDTATQKTLDDINSLIESEGAPVLRKLIEDPRAFMLNDWKLLSYLIANFAVRTPSTIGDVRAAELSMTAQVTELAGKMNQRLEEALLAGSDLSEFPQAIPDNESPTMTFDEMSGHAARLTEEGGHRYAAFDTFAALPDVAKIIQRMRLFVLRAPQGLSFMTSDRPWVLRSRSSGSPVGAGWANSDVQATIPLHPSSYVFIFHADSPGFEEPRQATPRIVNELNFASTLFANQEVYSPFKYAEADDWMRWGGHWSCGDKAPAEGQSPETGA